MAIGVLRANFTGLVLVSGVVIGSIELVGTGLGSVLQDLVFLQVGCAVPDATVGGVHRVLLRLDELLGRVNCDGELGDVRSAVVGESIGVDGSLGDHNVNLAGGAALGLAQHPVAAGVGQPCISTPIIGAAHRLDGLRYVLKGKGLIDEEGAASPGVRSDVREKQSGVSGRESVLHLFERSGHFFGRFFEIGVGAMRFLDGNLLVRAVVHVGAEGLAIGSEEAIDVEFAAFHLGHSLNVASLILFPVNGGGLADNFSVDEPLVVYCGNGGLARVLLHTGGGLSVDHAGA
mmetsp:Transcript_4306/g.8054  ORF Transcript_4306/g.8054 Transcript_4306/m.8054 type:complete len:289 (-) Transcript_4306:1036-1902(-)